MNELLAFEFMRYALLAGILASISCGILSNFVVLKKMEFIGDGAAHSTFGGIAVALLFGFNVEITAIITSLLFASIIYFVSRRGKIEENSVIGMLLSLSMALGIIFLSLKKGYTPEITSFLFGDILMVMQSDIFYLCGIFIVVMAFVTLLNKELKYYTFNQRMAKIFGINTEFINFVLLLCISVVVVITVKITGVILVTALLITPGVTAKLFAKSLNQMLVISAAVAVFSSITGIISSYYLNLPSGPMIVVGLFSVFLIMEIIRKISTYM